MFLRYKSLANSYRVNGSLKYLLRESICFLWFNDSTKDYEQWHKMAYNNAFIHNILISIWLKYWDNKQVMRDFWKTVNSLGTENEHKTLATLCRKYGRTISLAHIITAYNMCLMFIFQEENCNIIYKVLREAKLNKDFIKNATIDVKDFTFDDFIAKYDVKNKTLQTDYEFYDKNVKEFLKESLIGVKKLSFTNCDQADSTMPYFNGKCVTKIAKITLNKPLGLQILHVSVTIGNVLTHYFDEYRQHLSDTNAKNLVETDYKQFVNNIENILNKLYVNNSDFIIINNYLKLVNKSVLNVLRQVVDLSICRSDYYFSLQTEYNNPYNGLLDQKDGTAPITRIRKLCNLLDSNVVNQLINTPYDMWRTVLDAKNDKFDEIMDNFNNTIINCGTLIYNIRNNKPKRFISFDKNIAPKYFRIEKFDDGVNSIPWHYYIPLCLNFYEYFSTIGFTETDNMLKLREKCVKELEMCLINMQKLLDEGKLKEHIEVIYFD